MATNSEKDDSNPSAAHYVNDKGINELFEAMMIALMIHKPDDHLAFMRNCLDKVENNPRQINWDFFVTKSLSSSMNQKRQKPLPPIEYTKPIVFILSSSDSIKLCSRLLERYPQLIYLSINDIANTDEDEHIDRYDSIQHTIARHRSQANGFLIAGELDEQNSLKQWQEKLSRINLVLLLSSDEFRIKSNRNSHIIHINSNNDLDDILTIAKHYFDELFPPDVFLHQLHPNLPIIFCIDNHRMAVEETDVSIDDEFEMINEEENNNSFIYTLCQRLAGEFAFKHIQYGDFDQLKNEMIQSMGRCSGYIIDHFPTSLDDLQRFQSEIGSWSILIYIGERRTVMNSDQLSGVIEKFKELKKAIYVDCRMEVDEIYEDLKNEILEHI